MHVGGYVHTPIDRQAGCTCMAAVLPSQLPSPDSQRINQQNYIIFKRICTATHVRSLPRPHLKNLLSIMNTMKVPPFGSFQEPLLQVSPRGHRRPLSMHHTISNSELNQRLQYVWPMTKLMFARRRPSGIRKRMQLHAVACHRRGHVHTLTPTVLQLILAHLHVPRCPARKLDCKLMPCR